MAKLSLFIIPLTFLSWYYADILYTESIYEYIHRRQQPPSSLPVPHRPSATDDVVIGSQPDKIFYFIQISDLHISRFKHKYLGNFKRFLNTTLRFIQPRFVLVTGDLTDAKDLYKITSVQYRSEWVDYYSALAESGVLKKPGFWWDQRGNHDCFNVPSWESKYNYFKELSSVKAEHYSFQVNEEYGKYSFIALDACPVHGPSRPFNFFGYFDRQDMDFLKLRLMKHHDSNHTFILSHYPFSMTMTAITSDEVSFDNLSPYISVFLCGHLHKLAGGLGEKMHIHHNVQKFLELELADMKSHGSFRVVSVDHDFISFTDSSIIETSRSSLVVLITNPKDARYIIEEKEPVHRIKKSTHIRTLIFSPQNTVDRVMIMIDETLVGYAMFTGNSETPLWTLKWDPLIYDDSKLHNLTVIAIDATGTSGQNSLLFRVDGKREEMEQSFANLIISPRYDSLFRSLFIFGYMAIFIILLMLPKTLSVYLHKTRRYHRWRIKFSAYLIDLDKSHAVRLPPFSSISNVCNRVILVSKLRLCHIYRDFLFFVNASLFRLVTLASLPSTFYPLFFYFIYIPVGPFFVGELIPSSRLDDRFFYEGFGWFYLYGVWIENRWVPIADTWLYGLFELAYLIGPLIIYLSFCITPPEQLYAPRIPNSKNEKDIYYFPSRHNRRRYPLHRRIYVRLSVAFAVMYQLINVFFIGYFSFPLSYLISSIYYGKWAMILSPGKTWFVLWACLALYNHRWSFEGREIDLLEDEEDKQGPLPFFGFIKSIKRTNRKKE